QADALDWSGQSKLTIKVIEYKCKSVECGNWARCYTKQSIWNGHGGNARSVEAAMFNSNVCREMATLQPLSVIGTCPFCAINATSILAQAWRVRCRFKK